MKRVTRTGAYEELRRKYGGMGLDLSGACVILEEVNRSGANAGPALAQMYTTGTLLRHGSEEQEEEYLPKNSCRRAEVAGVRRDRA
jgi:alkylation response protein AidB-like acyl-CoA dehydrogenase